MADMKISELAAYTTPLPDDLIPVVDVANSATKKMTYADFTTRAHGTFSDSSTKGVSSVSDEYAVTYDTQDDVVGLTHALGDSKVYVPRAGTYLIAMSAVIDTLNNVSAKFDLWLKVNGVNLARSNTQVQTNSQNLMQVLSVTFVVALSAEDYFEFFYHANNTNARIIAVAAQAGPPAIPACPSVIVAVNKISS